jgi:hypothetical protein
MTHPELMAIAGVIYRRVGADTFAYRVGYSDRKANLSLLTSMHPFRRYRKETKLAVFTGWSVADAELREAP